ncbi:zinc ribbon domain-containing protein [Streptomyces sp. 2A115]|uniref:zinc ribbon domain-containing protein n=1 Tax=Streptomyces sp. 2A115 TaxID=3457439 RepID=UPI003FD085E0
MWRPGGCYFCRLSRPTHSGRCWFSIRKPQRVTLHSWSFHQLGGFVAYKTQHTKIPLAYVKPANTSRECSGCHHIDNATGPPRPSSPAGPAASLSTPT